MVIAPDTLGYGMSDRPDQPLSIEAYASDLPTLLTELNIESVTVIGHHTGASIASEFAKSNPDLIEKIILP